MAVYIFSITNTTDGTNAFEAIGPFGCVNDAALYGETYIDDPRWNVVEVSADRFDPSVEIRVHRP